MSFDPASLDDLFADAIAALPKKEAHLTWKDIDQAATRAKRALKAEYTDPKNWLRTRCITLVKHGTPLGNFAEYLHVKVAGVRRLVRDNDTPPTALEILEEAEACKTRTFFL